MSYEQRIKNFAKYGMDGIDDLFEDNAELMLSLDVQDAASKIVSVTRLRADLVPQSKEDAYKMMERILGELLADGRVKVLSHGLSTMGRNEFNRLVALSRPAVELTPEQKLADVVKIYKEDVKRFNTLRSTDPEFRKRSDEAHSLRLL